MSLNNHEPLAEPLSVNIRTLETQDEETSCMYALVQLMDSYNKKGPGFGMKPAVQYRIAEWFKSKYGDPRYRESRGRGSD